MAPHMDASLDIGTFPRLTTGPTMTNDQHELFSKFLKLKPPVFKGAESEDAYDFLVEMLGFRLVGSLIFEDKCVCHSRHVLGLDNMVSEH